MDAADLRVFEAVARLGAMNRAAVELNTVQSNVTARVRQLEDDLGTPLFRRHSRGVDTTPAGDRLLPYAVQMAGLLDDARRAVSGDGAPAGRLTIGSLDTTAAIRLSPVLATFANAYPAVDLTLRTGTTAAMIAAVLEGQLEGAFVCGPADHPALEVETVFVERLAIGAPPVMKRLADLANGADKKIVVLGAGCSYRQRLEQALAERGIVGLRILEFGTIQAILGCVTAGLGVTLLPEQMLQDGATAGELSLLKLPAAEARAETLFIRRKDSPESAALAAFLDVARPHRNAA